MSWLDDERGKSITVNGVNMPDRKNLEFTAPGATSADSEAQNKTSIDLTGLSLPKYDSMSDLRAVNPIDGNVVYTLGYASPADGGSGVWQGVTGVTPGTYSHNGGTVIVPVGGDGSAAWVRDYDGAISVKWFGATGDGSADDTTALQAAIDAVGITLTSLSQSITKSGEVFIPEGDYIINSPLTIYSALAVRGEGPASRLETGGSWTGTEMLQLVKSATGLDRYQAAGVYDLAFTSTETGVAAIRQNTPLVLNSEFVRLYFNCPYGVMLDTYTQKVLIDRLYSYGAIEQFVWLKGNDNVISNIDKEAGTGTSTEAYVLVEEHSLTRSFGNVLTNILLEGTGNANKAYIRLDGCDVCTINGVWGETTISNGWLLDLNNCGAIYVTGHIAFAVQPYRKIRVVDVDELVIEYLTVNSEDRQWRDLFSIDADSHIWIRNLKSRRGLNLHEVGALDVTIDNHYAGERAQSGSPNVALPAVTKFVDGGAENILVNPSFEAGRYGWTFDGSGSVGTEEYIQSEVAVGLMAHWDFTSGSSILYQNVTIPVDLVGQPLTFRVRAKFEGTAGYVQPYTSGVGISTSSGYFAFQHTNFDDGWHELIQTIVPQSSGTLSVGVRTNLATSGDIYLDDASLSYGTVALGATAKFGQIELGSHFGNSITYASAAPTAGTWKVGDIVFSNVPTAGGKVGWVCVTAGTPGTWKAFGGIDP